MNSSTETIGLANGLFMLTTTYFAATDSIQLVATMPNESQLQLGFNGTDAHDYLVFRAHGESSR
jgi:hypothetical protein